MYYTRKRHLLSNAVFLVTGINLFGDIFMAVFRLFFRKKSDGLPDMLNSTIWMAELISSVVILLLIVLVFVAAFRKIKRDMNKIREADRRDMGRLQEDMLGKKLSTLSADVINKLIQLWAVVFVGMQIISNITSIIYRRFANMLFDLYQSGQLDSKKQLVSIYNKTHGFKYLGMLCAILLGVMITAIFLEDRLLRRIDIAATVVFIVCFCCMDMTKMSIFGFKIGIVWTSVVFHLIETIGMVVFAIYLRRRYKGV